MSVRAKMRRLLRKIETLNGVVFDSNWKPKREFRRHWMPES